MTSHELFPVARRRHRIFGGLTEREEQLFGWIAWFAIAAFAIGWAGAIVEALRQQREIVHQQAEAKIKVPPPPLPAPTTQITSSLLQKNPAIAYISDAMQTYLSPLRGASGKLLFATRVPGSPIVANAPQFAAPGEPGMYKLAVKMAQAAQLVDNFNLITLVPFSAKQAGRIGPYFLGNWPFERRAAARQAYANPAGFIQVTPQNEDTPVSQHFRLRDFLTKDQPDVWPKYLLLNPKLVDKLELTLEELQAMGHPVVHVTVMSGFRTPNYNVHGGNTQGRANLSRHMYGDAADIFIDNDGNGVMDDLNGDGRVDVHDAEVILQAVERVERKEPSLVGGVGVYSACCGHGPFTHIDVRGFRARWRGTGNG